MISSRANAECKRKCMNHDINALLPFLQNSSAMLCTKASVDLKINSSYQPTRQIPIKAETLSNSHSLPNTPFKDNEKRPFLGMHQFSNQFNSPKQIREALDQKKKTATLDYNRRTRAPFAPPRAQVWEEISEATTGVGRRGRSRDASALGN